MASGSRDDAASWSGRLLEGLSMSVGGNSQAFGYSITITLTYGVISVASSHPTMPELFAFGLSAVAAFSLLNLFVALVLRGRSSGSAPSRLVLIATATDFLAVAGAIGAAWLVRRLTDDLWTWILAPLAASLAYMLVQTIELTVGRRGEEQSDDG